MMELWGTRNRASSLWTGCLLSCLERGEQICHCHSSIHTAASSNSMKKEKTRGSEISQSRGMGGGRFMGDFESCFIQPRTGMLLWIQEWLDRRWIALKWAIKAIIRAIFVIMEFCEKIERGNQKNCLDKFEYIEQLIDRRILFIHVFSPRFFVNSSN